MEDQLAIGSDAGFAAARKIYEKGGNSKSVAKVKLSTPLPADMKKGAAVSGQDANGAAVYGKLYTNYANAATTIEIQYLTSDVQKDHVGCRVGGLPYPSLDGCFGGTGTLTIDGAELPYIYDPQTQNVNKRTLQLFSEQAEAKMYRCENCPYETFRKYREYYGFFDYGDKWVTAALDGGSTSFARGNGECVIF